VVQKLTELLLNIDEKHLKMQSKLVEIRVSHNYEFWVTLKLKSFQTFRTSLGLFLEPYRLFFSFKANSLNFTTRS